MPATATAITVPPSATAVVPTATRVPPSATPVLPTATAVQPTATAVPPTKPPTAVPGVKVPDIRGQSLKDAQQTLAKAGLRLGQNRERCQEIGASDEGRKLKKGQIRCQSPAPGSVAAPNTAVLIVTENGGNPHD